MNRILKRYEPIKAPSNALIISRETEREIHNTQGQNNRRYELQGRKINDTSMCMQNATFKRNKFKAIVYRYPPNQIYLPNQHQLYQKHLS